jgi:hypothetical protein
MEMVGWLVVLAISVLAAFIAGYLVGYRSGFTDARDGLDAH